jgi:glucosamine--fructose-6-phosphate aminotransferase (isomerizing)
MCGIVGYTGPRKALPLLMQGLKMLEYRGYDSSGLALANKSGLKVYKKIGPLSNLEAILPAEAAAKAGIGHTRWATHGGVSDANAHPHLGAAGKVAVVHNGIIDNYLELKAELEALGLVFKSDTDSEVIAMLTERYLESGDSAGSPEAAVLKALGRLEGTYGLAFVFRDFPDLVIGARNGSPLAVGVGEKEMFLASDPQAFAGHTRQAVFIQDREMAVLRPGSWETRNLRNELLEHKAQTMEWSGEAPSKEGQEHFLIKEILEQPEAVSRAFGRGGRLVPEFGTAKLDGLGLSKRDLLDVEKVVFIGMGSALYACQVGAMLVEAWARVPAQALDASELRSSNPIVGKGDLYFAVSQSGETMDTLSAVKEIMEKGGRVLGIVNAVGSSLARLCGAGTYVHAGPEMSVASTKGVSGQLTVMAQIALMLGRTRFLSLSRGQALVEARASLPALMESVLKEGRERAREWGALLSKHSSVLYLGRGFQCPAAMEGALKLKEISYIHAEGFSSGNLKHGPLALVNEATPSVFVLSDGDSFERVLGNMSEVKARKGPIYCVSASSDPRLAGLADRLWTLPACPEELSPILTILPLQLIAYEAALALGRDIDRPRNLAKSVTTE